MISSVRTSPALATVVLLMILSACATPQQQCIARETSDYRALLAQIAEVEATIARGYALHRQTIPYSEARFCKTSSGAVYPCKRTRFHRLETPVTVDISAQRKQLKVLKSKRAKLSPRAQAAIAACRHAHRE